MFELAQQLKDAGTVSKKIEPAILAEMIWCTLHGIVSLHITCAVSLRSSPEALVRLATDTLAKGLNIAPANLRRSKKAAAAPAPRRRRST